jgi:hypothetical protein
MSVKIKISVGGIAITILNAIPLALSVRLVLRNCSRNGCHISYNEKPLKPGRYIF